MIRARVAVEAAHATAMNCEEARHGLSALVRGQIGLTDWALLEAHLKQCAECRQAEAHLRQLAAASRAVPAPRAALAALRKATERARLGVTGSTALVVRRRALLTAAARGVIPRATASVMRKVGCPLGHSADLMARIRASRARAHAGTARTIVSAWHAIGLGITQTVARVAHLRASLASSLRSSVAALVNAVKAVRLWITRAAKRAIRFMPPVYAMGAVLALAVTLYVLWETDGPQRLARPAAPPGTGLGPTRLEPPPVETAGMEVTRLEPAQVEPAQLAPVLSKPSVETKSMSAAPPRTAERRHAPSAAAPRADARAPSDGSASEPVRAVAPSPPTLPSEPPVSTAHVIGRLSAKNPGTARRDVIVLLADVGGTELGRIQLVRFTAVEVVVPQSRYTEFAEGLARIGSWRLEAARFPLPDAVHMTIRVSE